MVFLSGWALGYLGADQSRKDLSFSLKIQSTCDDFHLRLGWGARLGPCGLLCGSSGHLRLPGLLWGCSGVLWAALGLLCPLLWGSSGAPLGPGLLWGSSGAPLGPPGLLWVSSVYALGSSCLREEAHVSMRARAAHAQVLVVSSVAGPP